MSPGGKTADGQRKLWDGLQQVAVGGWGSQQQPQLLSKNAKDHKENRCRVRLDVSARKKIMVRMQNVVQKCFFFGSQVVGVSVKHKKRFKASRKSFEKH